MKQSQGRCHFPLFAPIDWVPAVISSEAKRLHGLELGTVAFPIWEALCGSCAGLGVWPKNGTQGEGFKTSLWMPVAKQLPAFLLP